MSLTATQPRVIVTRPEEDAARFSTALAGAGFAPALSPVLAIKFRDAAEPLDAALAGAGGLAFTSANGVRAFARLTSRRDLPAFAVGRVSAAEATEAGFSDVAAASGDVESLAAVIADAAGRLNGPVAHIAGSERRGDLIALLAERGAPARRVVLYDAAPAQTLSPAAIEAIDDAGPSDGPSNGRAAGAVAGDGARCFVTFFSPRSARLFERLLAEAGRADARNRLTAVCLSHAVAAALDSDAWAAIAVADARTQDAMIERLAGIISG